MTGIATDLARLLGLRPKDRSAASVAEALAAAEAEATAAALAVSELEAARGRLLLSAPPAEVEAAESDLAARRAVAERAGAMAIALRTELAAAQRAERRSDAERLSREAHEAVQDFAAWFRDAYPELSREMIAGFRIEDRARDLAAARMRALDAIEREDGPAARAEAEAALPAPPPVAVAVWGQALPASHHDVGIGGRTRLPGAEPFELAWPEDRRPAPPLA